MDFNLADLFEAVVDAVPDREALVCGERRLSFAAFDARANRLAHVLAEQGIGAGDHVALYLYNGSEYLEGMVAAFKLRAVPVNVNYRYVEEELRYLLDDSDARAVVFHQTFAPKLVAVRDQLPELNTFLAVGDDSGSDPGRLDALGGGGNPISTPEAIADRAAAGTTRCLPACPFMHGTAHWMAFLTLYTGGGVVVSPERSLVARHVWELAAAEHVNFLVIVGDAMGRPLVEALDELGPDVDVGGVAILLSGGAILSPPVKRALTERLPGTLVIDGFGSSEAGGQGQMIVAAEGDISAQPRFQVDDETTVLTPDLESAPVGVVGKLAKRGHVPIGYYHDPVKSTETFPVIDGVRWSVPGDDARREEDGTITVLGRGSVSINTGGEKVYPEEVEGALKAHPDVFDAVVVGVPDPRWGERVVAVIEPRDGRTPTLDALAGTARHQLAGFKVPRQVVLVDRVERSPSGKPDYRWAKRVAEAAS